jgi:hypothetical protein
MKRTQGDQGIPFGPGAVADRTRRLRPPRRTAVTISAAAVVDRLDAAHIITKAIRSARPEVRNAAVDLGTIRWTDPKTGRRVTFATRAPFQTLVCR